MKHHNLFHSTLQVGVCSAAVWLETASFIQLGTNSTLFRGTNKETKPCLIEQNVSRRAFSMVFYITGDTTGHH